MSPPQGLDRSCLMCLVMNDNSIVVCAESSDDMRYVVYSSKSKM